MVKSFAGRRGDVRGQSLVEFALVLPFLVIFVFGAIAVQTYINAQNQIQAAVTHAAFVAAREQTNPCVPGPASDDVVSAFDLSLTQLQAGSAPLQQTGSGYSAHPLPPNPVITCYSGGSVNSAWVRGGVVSVSAAGVVMLPWLPVLNQVPVSALSASQIEPYRSR